MSVPDQVFPGAHKGRESGTRWVTRVNKPRQQTQLHSLGPWASPVPQPGPSRPPAPRMDLVSPPTGGDCNRSFGKGLLGLPAGHRAGGSARGHGRAGKHPREGQGQGRAPAGSSPWLAAGSGCLGAEGPRPHESNTEPGSRVGAGRTGNSGPRLHSGPPEPPGKQP